MEFFKSSSVYFLLLVTLSLNPARADQSELAALQAELDACRARLAAVEKVPARATLEFRANLAMYSGPPAADRSREQDPANQSTAISNTLGTPSRWDSSFWDRDNWIRYFDLWSSEGFNTIVWWGPSEMHSGTNFLLELKEFPEGRSLSLNQIAQNRDQMKWIYRAAKDRSMNNYVYCGVILLTPAFARAHRLDDPNLPISPTVSCYHTAPPHHMGVRNDLTRRYIESVVAEEFATYQDLDGYYFDVGEPVPGRVSTYFGEAIVPGLRRSGRKPHMIVIQWEIPMQDYIRDIAPKEVYGNTWLALHGYNSEALVDAQPWPFITEWAQKVGLPTVATLYPANVHSFPLNSPQFAYEIVAEMKRIPNFKGFLYFEWSGRKLSPLFRKSLAYYAAHNKPWSDKPWLALLEQQFGDPTAAQHFLTAWDLSARIIPETDALVWCGHDTYRRELRLPWDFLTGDGRTFGWLTSRVRGTPLQPIWHYAQWAGRYPHQYRDKNGADPDSYHPSAYDNFRQIPLWGTEGGSVYDIIPPVHMAQVRHLADDALAAARLAMPHVKRNHAQAQQLLHWMNVYQRLAHYYQAKVSAACLALMYRESKNPEHRTEALERADDALQKYLDFARYAQTCINPILRELYNEEMRDINGGPTLDQLIELEKTERADIAQAFKWPDT